MTSRRDSMDGARATQPNLVLWCASGYCAERWKSLRVGSGALVGFQIASPQIGVFSGDDLDCRLSGWRGGNTPVDSPQVSGATTCW
mgnify:CR=1 FL=1